MLRRGFVVALVAAAAVAAASQAASADPTNAKNSTIITAVCNGQEMQASVNGNGEFTPGHIVGSTAVLVPTSFDITFSFTPTGGTTESETDTSAKHNEKAGSVTCDIPAELNTFTMPEGTFVISGTVTGFFTAAKG
jgi:hypothetical protein